MKKITILSILALMLSSCSQRVMDFTIISSKNIDLKQLANCVKTNNRIEGKDTKHIIVIIPTGKPDAKEAIDRAIESVPGAVAILDGVLTYKWFIIPYIYGQFAYVVEGTPLINPNYNTIDNIELKDFSITLLNKDGGINKTIVMSESEYTNTKSEILKSPQKVYKRLLK